MYDKTPFDEVTSIDLEIERRLIERIKEYDHDAHFLSEEFNSCSSTFNRTWIIDPIDGTVNFSHGIPAYGIQCALFDENETKLSVLYFPESDDLYTAIKGCGAKLNNRSIRSLSRPVNRSIISFGDFVHGNSELLELENLIMKHVSKHVEKIRMYGAASMDFAYCASGRINGNFTFVKNALQSRS